MSRLARIVNLPAYQERHGKTAWENMIVDTWFLQEGAIGSLTMSAETEEVVRRLPDLLEEMSSRCRGLQLKALGLAQRDRGAVSSSSYRTLAEGHSEVVSALPSLLSFDLRRIVTVSVELEMPVDIETASGPGTNLAYFALDVALARLDPTHPPLRALSLVSECWSVLRRDNREDVALAYLADRNLLREAAQAPRPPRELLRFGDLEAIAAATRRMGGFPVERARLEFSHQCALVLRGEAAPLASNEELAELNSRRVGGVIAPIAAFAGGEWRWAQTLGDSPLVTWRA